MPEGKSDEQLFDELLDNKPFVAYYINKLQGKITELQGLLAMASEFMASVEYDTVLDAAQATSILQMICNTLEEDNKEDKA